LPGFEKGIRLEDFTNLPTTLSTDYRFVAPRDASEDQLYPYIDLSHQTTTIREANDLSLRQRAELYKRWYRWCPKGFLHLEKLIGDRWRPIAVSIVLPLTLDGYHAVTDPNKKNRVKVIDLNRAHISAELPKKSPRFLLIDTWIVHRDFRGAGHGKSAAAGGYANALVLRHMTRFWDSNNRGAEIKFLVETTNRRLIPVLRDMAFRRAGRSKIGVSLYLAERSIMKGITPETFGDIVKATAALTSVSIDTGTAPKN
jgi:hypothetical protein